MSLKLFEDYAFCPQATYIGSVGIGKGCLLGTQKTLLGLPEKIDTAVWNHSWTTTTYSIEGMSPGEAIQGVANLDVMTPESFETALRELGQRCEGAVWVDLTEQKRLKLRAGLCTKGIYWSSRASGPGWRGYGLGDKEMTQKWIDFYQDHPISV